MYNRIFIYCLFTVLLFVSGCANVRNPQGGQKDDIPPVVVMSNPAPFSTQFSSKTIVLTFDEYVRLNDIQNNLVISPPLTVKPKIKVRGKSVIVELQEELRANTTYLFNFGDGVVDVNESNKAQDLMYVFSTGDVIDSLELNGLVWDNYNDVPAQNFKVLAYDNDTSVFDRKSVPLYFTRSKSDGTFIMPFMSEGDYYLYALDDQNANNRWDDGEAIALDSSKYNPLNDSLPILFRTSIPRSEKLYINDIKADSLGNIKFALDKYYQDVAITSLNSDLNIASVRTTDTVFAWINGVPTIERPRVVIQVGEAFIDTLQVLYHPDAFAKTFKLNASDYKKIKREDSVILKSTMPLTVANKDAIVLKRDSIETAFDIKQDSLSYHHAISAEWQAGGEYHLTVLPGAFTNINGTTHDTLNHTFSVLKKDELGRLIIALTIPDTLKHGRLFLTDKQNVLHYDGADIRSGELVLDNLIPGDYFLRILDDANHNGIYDPLDVKQKGHPETWYVYPGKINLRANWDLKIDWTLKE
jgi:hypothetical protein